MGDVSIVQIGDVADVTKLSGFEYTDHFEYVDDGEIIALRALNVRDGTLDLTDVKRIRASVSDELPRSKLYKWDILFTYVGANIGQFAFVPENDKFHLAPNICRIRCGEVLHPYYLYSYFRTQEFKETIEGFRVGSSQPTMPMGNIRQIPVPFRALSEQKAIAEVLSSLDDKIDLLHRQNKTLESLAETLFRHTFIDNVQDDWEEVTLGYFAKNPRDGAKPQEISSDTVYVGLEHIERVNISLTRTGSASEVTSQKHKFLENDILFGKLRPYFHKVCVAPCQGICSTDILVVRPKQDFYFGFCLFAFFQKDVIDFVDIGSDGTRMPRTNWETLASYPMLLPPVDTIKEFNEFVVGAISKLKKNIKTIHALEKLRDTLLPKLMNGEVHVNYGETVQ